MPGTTVRLLSSVLFCPTKSSVENLRREGIVDGVHWTGDVMFDQLMRWRSDALPGRVARFGVEPGRYVLATVHRAENTDSPVRLGTLLAAFRDVGLPS